MKCERTVSTQNIEGVETVQPQQIEEEN